MLFAQALPPGARPDLNVDGNIELERLPTVTSIACPVPAPPTIPTSNCIASTQTDLAQFSFTSPSAAARPTGSQCAPD